MARARTPTLGDEPIIAGALERSALRRHYPVHFRNEACRPLVVSRQAPSYFFAEPRRLLPFSAAGRLSGRCASPSHCGSGGLHACPHPPLTHDPSTARAQDVGSL
jgi:hypothetical protein